MLSMGLRMSRPTFSSTVINLIAGPGAGKSTLAAGLFAELKFRGIECELATEYAKDLLWEGRLGRTHKYDILMSQYHRLWRLRGKVKYIITDSPLILPGIYNSTILPLAEQLWREFSNINWFIQRVKPYSPIGRRENEESARSVDQKILDYLDKRTDWSIQQGTREGLYNMVANIMGREVN